MGVSVIYHGTAIIANLQEEMAHNEQPLKYWWAQGNLRCFHAKPPLVGHLLPYVTGEEAKQQGWRFHEEHVWVEVS